MSLFNRKSVLLAKIETTYGVDASPTGALNAMLVKGVSVTPLAQDLVQRDVVQPFFGNDEQIPTGTRVELKFAVELAGSGTAGTAPKYAPLLLACAMLETVNASTDVTYTPVTDNIKSATMIYNLDGVQHKMLGARGSVSFSVSAKGIPEAQFSFVGLYADVVDASVLSVDYSGFEKPLAANDRNTTTAELHGNAIVMQSFSLDVGNSVVYRNLVGSESVLITDRASKGQVMFEAQRVADYDWFAAVRDGDSGSINIVHGLTAGNIVEFVGTSVQIVNPQIGDSDGVAMMTVDTNFIPSTAGNDEWSLIIR